MAFMGWERDEQAPKYIRLAMIAIDTGIQIRDD